MTLLLAWSVVAFVLAAQAGATPTPASVSIDLPAWVRGGACVVAGKSIAVRATEERTTIAVSCAEPEGMMSCDLAGAEPLDVPLRNVCTSRHLPVEASRPVAIAGHTTAGARIDWLELQADGRFETRASRDISLDERKAAVVPVARGRFLRVTPKGASPVTINGDRLSPGNAWNVPVSPGGEVLIGLEAAAVLPGQLLIRGSDERRARVDDSRVVTFSSLPPGKYVVALEFAGGVGGERFALTVDAGESTVLVLPAANVGAVRVFANATACDATAELRVANNRVRGQVVGFAHHGRCDQTVIAGLEPGEYAVWLGTAFRSYVSRIAVVDRQEITDVPLQAVQVTLSGRVLVNGRPESDVRIQVQKKSGGVPETWAVHAGQYSGTFGEPGEYTAILRAMSGLLELERRTLVLEEGLNYADWSVEAGVLRIDVLNWDRASRVEAVARRLGEIGPVPKSVPGYVHQMSMTILIEPDATLPLRYVGLPFDEYRVTATQLGPTRRVAAPVKVLLTRDQPEREIVLDLDDAGRTLTLVDENGRPISGASITGPAKEVSPGIFELAARPGSQILIRTPGFATACRVTPEERFIQVVLRRGRPLQVDIVGKVLTHNLSTSLMLAGSDCEVPLFVMDHVELPDAGDGVRRFLFSAFPPEMSIGWRWPGGAVARVDVPVTGPLVLHSGR